MGERENAVVGASALSRVLENSPSISAQRTLWTLWTVVHEPVIGLCDRWPSDFAQTTGAGWVKSTYDINQCIPDMSMAETVGPSRYFFPF